MDLNTNIHLGTGKILLRRIRAIQQIAIECEDGLVDLSSMQPHANKVGHLFVKMRDGSRTSLGKGRLVINTHSIGITSLTDGTKSAFVDWCLKDLIQLSERGNMFEIYVRFLENAS